jgi:hypothetical protein
MQRRFEMSVGIYDPGQVHMAHCGVGLPEGGDLTKLEILSMQNEPLQFSSKDRKDIAVRRIRASQQFLLSNEWFYEYTHIGVEQQVLCARAKKGSAAEKILEAKNLKCAQIAGSMMNLAETRNLMMNPRTKRPCTKPVVFNDSPQRKLNFALGRAGAPKTYYRRKSGAKNFARSFFKNTAPVNDHWIKRWERMDKGRQADISDCLWAAVTYITSHKQKQYDEIEKKRRKTLPRKRKTTTTTLKTTVVIDLTLEEEESEEEERPKKKKRRKPPAPSSSDYNDESLYPPPICTYSERWKSVLCQYMNEQ